MKSRREHQEEFERLDWWLQHLHAKHPLRFLFLSAGLAVLVFAAAMLLKFFVECLPKGVGQP